MKKKKGNFNFEVHDLNVIGLMKVTSMEEEDIRKSSKRWLNLKRLNKNYFMNIQKQKYFNHYFE